MSALLVSDPYTLLSRAMPSTLETADSIELLVGRWRPRLLEVDGKTAHEKPSQDRWSISEVVGHLVDSATNNHQRFVRAQSSDPFVFPKYEQNEWVSAAGYRHFEWSSLVILWAEYNRMLAVLIRNVPAACLATSCTIGPYAPCTLEFLIIDYLDHMNHHLSILDSRIGNLG